MGEFGFLIASRGRALGLLSREVYMLLLGTTAMSLLTSPMVLALVLPAARGANARGRMVAERTGLRSPEGEALQHAGEESQGELPPGRLLALGKISSRDGSTLRELDLGAEDNVPRAGRDESSEISVVSPSRRLLPSGHGACESSLVRTHFV